MQHRATFGNFEHETRRASYLFSSKDFTFELQEAS